MYSSDRGEDVLNTGLIIIDTIRPRLCRYKVCDLRIREAATLWCGLSRQEHNVFFLGFKTNAPLLRA